MQRIKTFVNLFFNTKNARFTLLLCGCCLTLSAQNTGGAKIGDGQYFSAPKVVLNGKNADNEFKILMTNNKGVSLYYLKPVSTIQAKAEDFVGLFFEDLKNVTGEVALWRYKPWNSWSKPVALNSAHNMPDFDVQFFYWQYRNGTYGAAVPLSGNGYRTTLGSQGNKWGSKSINLNQHEITGEVPAIAIAFDKNPFNLFRKIYEATLTVMGKSENLRYKKQFPEPFKYFGWCTWNSSEMGQNLSEDEVINGVKTFADHHFPLGWVLIDDGWFQSKNGQLQSQLPNSKKFPNGFSRMNSRLKNDFGIKYTGIWHAFNGYWNGIDPGSDIGKQYNKDLFSWEQGGGTWMDTTANKKTFYFIKPETESLSKFYDSWYKYFKNQGFDFTKVDNQLVAERMALNNYPVFSLSQKIHQAIYQSSAKYFNGALINCMDMTPDAYFNFGSSAIARTVEDYFPYKSTENYNLQQGNAAAHVLQAIYNSVYFSQMVYPDFDMFESDNPNAVFHAIARALNCGPIYITDKPGNQNFDILNALVYHDGKIVNSQQPLLPTADCLFQVQSKKIFKAFSTVGNTGLLSIFNAADTNMVSGSFSPADVDHIKGKEFVVYEHFSNQIMLAKKHQQFTAAIPRLGYKLYYIVPIINGFGPFGLTEKYNAPATILKSYVAPKKASVTLYEGGLFKAYSLVKPRAILINGKSFSTYQFENNILTIPVLSVGNSHPILTFTW